MTHINNFTLVRSKIILLLLSSLSTLSLLSQVPDNLNFLNHGSYNSSTAEIELFNNYLLAADRYGFDKVSYDYQLKQYNHGKADKFKLGKINDTTAYYASWYFDCGDCFVDELKTSIITADSIGRDDYNLNPGLGDWVQRTYDITHDSTGGWWCLTDQGSILLHLKEGRILDSIETNLIYPDQIFTSCSGDIFILNYSGISYFDGEKLINNFELPLASELYTDNEFTYLLEDNNLYKYTCDLSVELKKWSLPEGVSSFKNITIRGNDVIDVALIDDTSYEIIRVDSQSNSFSVYLNQFESKEKLNEVISLSDTTHLIYGSHEFQLSSFNFFRAINQTKVIDYPTVDVSISDFTINYESGVLLENDILDTIVQLYHILPQTIIANDGNELVYALGLHSSVYNTFDFWVPFQILNHELSEAIPPDELRQIDFNQSQTTIDELTQLKIELAGANYKFLTNGSIVLDADVLSILKYIEDIQEFEVYPNPTSDFITVEESPNSDIYIISNQGSIVLSKELDYSGIINIQELDSGIYTIVIENQSGKTKLARIVKI